MYSVWILADSSPLREGVKKPVLSDDVDLVGFLGSLTDFCRPALWRSNNVSCTLFDVLGDGGAKAFGPYCQIVAVKLLV